MTDSPDNPRDAWEEIAASLLGEPEFTPSEVAQRSGVDLEQARRLWRALGFAPVADDNRVFTAADVTMLQATQRLLDEGVTTPSALVQLTRTTGQSLARLADAHITIGASRPENGPAAMAPNDSKDIARALTSLVPSFENFLMYVWRRHLLAALLRMLAGRTALPESTGKLVIGFADLVEFTAISQKLDPTEIAAMVDHFEALAYAQIPERGGRVIKMIGDAVMFAVDDPRAAADIALALQEGDARDTTLPPIRVGLAWGPAVALSGDLFGPTVNLASRLVDAARPGSVLISDELGKYLEGQEGFDVRRKRRVGLKGIGRVRVWVVRRGKTKLAD